MANSPQTITFTSNTSSFITNIKKKRDLTQYVSMILAYGTFGSGTLSFYLSPDNGTTKIALTSSAGGTGISLTANGMFVITLGAPSINTEELQLWATLSGATNPSITVKNYDNNN